MSLDLAPESHEEITQVSQLEEYFRRGERPRAQHQVGIEHEKLLFKGGTVEPLPYDGSPGIRELLERLLDKGYAAFRETPQSPIIALTRGKSTITLEPGGQLEFSGSPAASAREAHAENLRHLEDLEDVCAELGVALAAIGYRPFGPLADMPWMPKTRYRIMRQSLGPRGALALDMMLMTATGQVSLDWTSEGDCSRKLGMLSRVAPIVTALFANSPLKEGRPTGFLSYRSHVWTQVDVSRCGYVPGALDGSFSYRRYVEWALDVPLLFVRVDNQYRDVRCTFRQLMSQGVGGRPALMSDWTDHLSTLFPEVRLKRVIEFRSADGVGAAMTGGLAALLRGLSYDDTALAEAEALAPRLADLEHRELHALAAREGLAARVGRQSLAELARALISVARGGLRRLDPQDEPLLDCLDEVASSGRSPAQVVLSEYARDRDPRQLLARLAPRG